MARTSGDGRGRLGGRKKGTPNKVTKDLREFMKNFAVDNFNEFMRDWRSLENKKEKCDIYIKCCNYVLPKLCSMELDAQVQEMSYQEELDKLSEE